jgi:hypothetical protein
VKHVGQKPRIGIRLRWEEKKELKRKLDEKKMENKYKKFENKT